MPISSFLTCFNQMLSRNVNDNTRGYNLFDMYSSYEDTETAFYSTTWVTWSMKKYSKLRIIKQETALIASWKLTSTMWSLTLRKQNKFSR